MANNSGEVHIDFENKTAHKRNNSGVDSITLPHNSGNNGTHSHHNSNSNSNMAHHSKPKPSIRELIVFYRRRLLKLSLLLLISLALTGVYLEFFNHPPADVLLVMNSYSADGEGKYNDFGASAFIKGTDEGEGCEEGEECETKGKRSINIRDPDEIEDYDYWQSFLKRNNFVPIGGIYDKCEDWRVQYGTVVLMEDKEFGGIKARTFVNMTLDEELSTAEFHIEVKYNSQDLYDNYWEACELEDDLPMENRTFACPMKAGHHSKVKDKHIPGYLPTGRYQTKAWVLDESEKYLACAYSDFKL